MYTMTAIVRSIHVHVHAHLYVHVQNHVPRLFCQHVVGPACYRTLQHRLGPWTSEDYTQKYKREIYIIDMLKVHVHKNLFSPCQNIILLSAF